MSVAFTEANIESIRRRLQAMDDDALQQYGKASAYLCTPEANHGKSPRETFVLQRDEARAEWKRRRTLTDSPQRGQ